MEFQQCTLSFVITPRNMAASLMMVIVYQIVHSLITTLCVDQSGSTVLHQENDEQILHCVNLRPPGSQFFRTGVIIDKLPKIIFSSLSFHHSMASHTTLPPSGSSSCQELPIQPPWLSWQGESGFQSFDLDGVGSILAIPQTQITCFVDLFNKLE